MVVSMSAQEQAAGCRSDASFQGSGEAAAAARGGVVCGGIRLQRQGHPIPEAHAERGALRQHLPNLQGERLPLGGSLLQET